MPCRSLLMLQSTKVTRKDACVVRFDSTRLDTMFQDAAGTIPCVFGGLNQPLGRWRSLGTITNNWMTVVTGKEAFMTYNPPKVSEEGGIDSYGIVQFDNAAGQNATYSVPRPLSTNTLGSTLVMVHRIPNLLPGGIPGAGRPWNTGGTGGSMPTYDTFGCASNARHQLQNSSGGNPPIGFWYDRLLLTVTVSNMSDLKCYIYINNSTVIRPNTVAPSLARNNVDASVTYTGSLCEMRLYDIPLTTDELKLLFDELEEKWAVKQIPWFSF